jgi:4a-hydroxytetrahydrobiopterin dehydratase
VAAYAVRLVVIAQRGAAMPTRLSEVLVRDALTRLDGWSGDDQAIHREFVLDMMARQRLCADIDALAGAVHHSILVTDRAAGLDVTLATVDVDGVSEVDIAVASRINDLFNGSAAGLVPQQRLQASLNTEVLG